MTIEPYLKREIYNLNLDDQERRKYKLPLRFYVLEKRTIYRSGSEKVLYELKDMSLYRIKDKNEINTIIDLFEKYKDRGDGPGR